MSDTLSAPVQTFSHFMSSQPGNSHDSAAYTGHPSSFIIGAEADPDNLSRPEFAQPTALPSDMGLRFMTIPVSDESRFGPDSEIAHSAVYSNDTSSPSPAPLSAAHISSLHQNFPRGLSSSVVYPQSDPSFFPSNQPNYYVPDLKPAVRYHSSDIRPISGYSSSQEAKPYLGSYSLSPTMAPPSRSPNMPHLSNPGTTRELYASAQPQLQLRRATEVLSRSPSATNNMRNVPISPSSSSGFASPANAESSNSGPPLLTTENLCLVQTSEGQNVRVEILGKVDKGFFMADNDWTCYRRNYFQLSCSYTLHPLVPPSSLHVIQNGVSHPVHAFAMSIAAVVDGREGRTIDLVQHTPKRDKGPQVRPDRVTLAARAHPSVQSYGADGTRHYDQNYGPIMNQPAVEHTYERIQFKCATANNGRRRAAQQYYHLVVELCVDIGSQMGENRWLKIAQRISAPVVVRGRSPGHYHSERRHSNASAGGSAGPNDGGASYGGPNNGIGRGPSTQMSLQGGQMVQSSGYGENYESKSHHWSRANIEVPMEPIMSAEEIKTIDEAEGYLYYPSPIYEGTGLTLPHVRSHFGSMGHRDDRGHGLTYQLPNPGPKIKQEPGSFGGYSLPSLTAGPPADSIGRHFGRFEGLPSSRGVYPTVFGDI